MAIVGPTTDHNEIRRWAESKLAGPVEVLPNIVDSVPAVLRIMLIAQVEDHLDVRSIPWDEFFAKFEALGLTFVYDNGPTGYNEILQKEDQPAFTHPDYYPRTLQD